MLAKLLTAAVVVAALIVVRVAIQRGAARQAGLDGAQPPTSCRSGLCGTCDESPNDAPARHQTGRQRHRS